MEYQKVVRQFIDEKGWKDQPEVEGILFYGSRATGYARPSSSLDLLILTNQGESYRGGSIFRGTISLRTYPIEYWIRPFYLVSRDIGIQLQYRNNSYVSIFERGEILYDRNDHLKLLKSFAMKSFYEKPLPSSQIILYEKNKLQLLERATIATAEQSSIYFPVYYFEFLEEIRRSYHRSHGCSSLPCTKVYNIYSDPAYAKEAFCAIIPEQEFIDLYLDAAKDGLSCRERVERIEKLYEKLPLGERIVESISNSSFSVIADDEKMRPRELPVHYSFLSSLTRKFSYSLRKDPLLPISSSEESNRYLDLSHSYFQVNDEIKNDAPNSDALYYQLINTMEKFYEKRVALPHYDIRDQLAKGQLVEEQHTDFVDAYLGALKAASKEEKCTSMFQLFSTVTCGINFDLHNYQFQLKR